MEGYPIIPSLPIFLHMEVNFRDALAVHGEWHGLTWTTVPGMSESFQPSVPQPIDDMPLHVEETLQY